jgi:hypothetical protein
MVNTFLPYANFTKCAKVLDNRRLGKQRVEAKQIITILTGKAKSKAWRSHPVVLMWDGYVNALMLYYNTIVAEWIARGFQNNMPIFKIKGPVIMPWFIGNKSFHLSFQANLLRKEPDYYKKYFKSVPETYLPYTYIWPTKLTDNQRKMIISSKNKVVPISEFTTIRK